MWEIDYGSPVMDQDSHNGRSPSITASIRKLMPDVQPPNLDVNIEVHNPSMQVDYDLSRTKKKGRQDI